MFKLWLLASAILLVSAEPKKCCVDREFEAVLGEFGAYFTNTSNLLDGFNQMSYNYYDKIMRLESYMIQPDGTMDVTNVIIDYLAGKEYVTSSLGCFVLDTNETMREPCVPDNAHFVGNSTFGYGSKSLHVNTWQYKKPHSDNIVNLVVTADGCVPVAEASHGTMKSITTNVVYFISNFSTGIKDRRVFNIPKNCKHGGQAIGVVGRAVRAAKNMY